MTWRYSNRHILHELSIPVFSQGSGHPFSLFFLLQPCRHYADIMQTLRRRYADVTQMMCKLSQCRGASSHPAYLFGADGDTDEPWNTQRPLTPFFKKHMNLIVCFSIFEWNKRSWRPWWRVWSFIFSKFQWGRPLSCLHIKEEDKTLQDKEVSPSPSYKW